MKKFFFTRAKIIAAALYMCVFSIPVCAVCAMSACDKGGLEIGFERFGQLPSFMCAAKSDCTEFDADDVTLDFYFGGTATEYGEDSEREAVGVAVCFCGEEGYSGLSLDAPYGDFRQIGGLSFVEFIGAEDFNSGRFAVTVSRFGRVKFSHRETLTVPAEFFSEEADHFGIALLDIYRVKGLEGYRIGTKSCMAIKYEFTGEGRVRLSAPSHTFK